MSDSERVVSVNIFGQSYTIRASVQDEEYVRAIARFVDGKMHDIQKMMQPESTQKVAILTALNIADELFALQDERDRLVTEYREKINSYTEVLDKSLKD